MHEHDNVHVYVNVNVEVDVHVLVEVSGFSDARRIRETGVRCAKLESSLCRFISHVVNAWFLFRQMQ